jgi:hypothetical protein
MPIDEELDKAVATEVMLWTFRLARSWDPTGWYDGWGTLVFLTESEVFTYERNAFSPSSRMDHAWMVAVAMRERGFGVLVEDTQERQPGMWMVTLIGPLLKSKRPQYRAVGPAPRAICQAALEAVRAPTRTVHGPRPIRPTA